MFVISFENDFEWNKNIMLQDTRWVFQDIHNLNKIEIIENAINITNRKFVRAIDERSTHKHKKNMIFTFKQLISFYISCFNHSVGYYKTRLSELIQKRLKELREEIINPIYDIIMEDDFTHWNQEILVRPYLFDFQYECYISHYETYKRLKEKLQKEYIKRLKELYEIDKEIIDEEIISSIPEAFYEDIGLRIHNDL